MTTPLLAVLVAAIGLPLGGVVARQFFGKLAISAACKKAMPDIEKFKKNNTAIRPLSQKFRDAASVFHDMLGIYKIKREDEMAVLRQYRIPKPQISLDINEIGEPKIVDVQAFINVMKSSGKRNSKRKIIRHVQHRLKEMRVKEMTVSAAAAGAALDDNGKITEEALRNMDQQFQETYDKLMKQLEPHLDGLAKLYDDILKETHIADAAEQVAKVAHTVGVDVMGEHAYHVMNAKLESILDHTFMSSTTWRAITTGKYELEALLKGDTDIVHAVAEGGMAVGLKAAANALAIATGVGIVGMIAFNMASGLVNNVILNELNNDRIARYNVILDAIREHLISSRRIIDGIAKEFDDEFQRRVELYPDINDEKVMNDWLEEVVDTFNKGLKAAEEKLTENAQKAISELPENNWLDRALGIDRREAVANLYRRAQREVSNRHASTVYAFTNARDLHAMDALAFLRDEFVFPSDTLVKLLDRLETVSEDTEESYKVRYSDWHTDITKFGEEEGGRATEKMMDEARSFNEYKEFRIPELEELTKKINQTRKRMGARSTPQPRAA